MEALSFVSIIEKDKHDTITTSWVYPGFPAEYNQVLINRGQFQGTIDPPLIFSRYAGLWHYTYTFNVGSESLDIMDTSLIRFTTVASVTVGSKHFYPERYFPIVKLLAQMYLDEKGRPLKILQSVLNLASEGTITFRDQEVTPPSFDEEKKSLLKTPLTDVTDMFGVQSILLWHALLTKRSVLVKSDNLGKLLNLIRAFPLFVFHRQDWTMLRPFITAHDTELQDLSFRKRTSADDVEGGAGDDDEDEKSSSSSSSSKKSKGKKGRHSNETRHTGVVCGTCDSAVEALGVWDVIADMETGKVTVREASEDRDDDSEVPLVGPVFEMTPFHKEAAAIVKKSQSQKELVTGLTNLTVKLTERVSEIKEELEGKPITPNNVKELLGAASMATCRFLVDLYKAETSN
ncbi:putative FAM45 family protein [Monocercomonoides exilis]|uniref:putative FAM45 family protein n=1 Tax=Monocercomonoides exilis TaxID=2049356 RepID=UPI00355A4B4D|nr:putative FAM45 family protein [Monocercomonoides exilis]|eukprot:MONOS_2775.1-p1 / transcript=MONOS_2775.1 / gene=MONOS_2775 / organism=Monocercomonoides_exilis_PA203 / gene_product=FAM45 family protein / transcript_product=FAM45 family protein / location=Mono_scaffold00059:86311-87962(-) / protein_length=402 / sequence_SO=supercontig / SO=protein_coding / is_pseudo=false